MRKFFLISAIFTFLLCNLPLLSQNQTSIRLVDPQGMWRQSKATMDSLTVIIQPFGGYTQISYLVNISTRSTTFDNIKDTVEIESFFVLPESAIVNDSWLWVEDTLVFADLIDRWTASRIYENIVHRTRRDPSLFLKNNSTQYEYRLFPLAGTQYRKFLISFLIPNNVVGEMFEFAVPTIWFSQTNTPAYMKLVLIDNPSVKDLYFWHRSQPIEMNTVSDYFFGQYKFVNLAFQDFLSNPKFRYSANFNKGLSISNYNVGGEKYYHMIFDKASITVGSKPTKHLYLFEYLGGKAIHNLSSTIDVFFEQLNTIYNSNDIINIMYCNNVSEVKTLRDEFVNASAENLSRLKDELKSKMQSIAGFLNLPLLLNSAVSYIMEKDTNASIVIFSNSDELGTTEIGNALVSNIMSRSKGKIPFYALDYGKVGSYRRFTINNQNYYGNEYLYLNLSMMTGGEYLPIWRSKTEYTTLFNDFKNISIVSAKDFNYYLFTKDGFTFQNFNPLPVSTEAPNIVSSIGKYVGSDEFIARFTYIFDNKPVISEITIKSDEILRNTALPQIWVGNYIRDLENVKNHSNKQKKEIIDISMRHRVLSLYTAFLALEPWMRDSLLGGNDPDDPVLSDIEDEIEIIKSNFGIAINPNPATTNATIKLNAPISTTINSIAIYDMKGTLVRKLDTPSNPIFGEYQVFWDLLDEYGNKVADGVYYVIIDVGLKSITQKIVVVK